MGQACGLGSAWGGEQGLGARQSPPQLGVVVWVRLWVASGLTFSTLGLSFPPLAQGFGGSDQEGLALVSDLLQLLWGGRGVVQG